MVRTLFFHMMLRKFMENTNKNQQHTNTTLFWDNCIKKFSETFSMIAFVNVYGKNNWSRRKTSYMS